MPSLKNTSDQFLDLNQLNEKLTEYANYIETFKVKQLQLENQLSKSKFNHELEKKKSLYLDSELLRLSGQLNTSFSQISKFSFVESELDNTKIQLKSLQSINEELVFKLSKNHKDLNQQKLKCDEYFYALTEELKRSDLNSELLKRAKETAQCKEDINASLSKKVVYLQGEIQALQEELCKQRHDK